MNPPTSPKKLEVTNNSSSEEKNISSQPNDDTAPLLFEKRKTINYTGNDGVHIKYTGADVILPKQIEMAERKNTFNAMKSVLDNKISTITPPLNTPTVSLTSSQRNARTRTLGLSANPTDVLQQQSNDDLDKDNDHGNNNDNNGTGMITNSKDIDKLKNEVYQFKLTTEKLEKDMMDEMSVKIDEHRREITRITDNTNLSQTDKNSLVASLESNIVEVRKYYQMRINEIRSDLEQKQKELRKIQNPKKGMNWDRGNITTLDTWIKECNKQQFVYDSVLDKIISRSKAIKVIMLILCAIQSLITVSNLGITENDSNYYLVLGIKIVISVISAITYVLTQYMSLEKFEEDIKKYTSYIETLGNFMSDMVSIADIKLELRPDGDKFIVENKDVYSNIYRTSPYIKQSYWIDSIKDYNKYLDNLDAGGNDYKARKRRLYNRYAALDRPQLYKGIRTNAKNSVVLNIDNNDHPHD